MKELNSVVMAMIISLIIFWTLGSTDFAINLTLCWVLFGLLELGNKIISGKTISQKFWAWKETASRWKVATVSISIAVLGIYFCMHLWMKW